MLKLDNASITFYAGTVNERKALDHVSLHLKKGGFRDRYRFKRRGQIDDAQRNLRHLYA